MTLLKNEIWSTKPYCAEIVSGSLQRLFLFFLLTRSTKSDNTDSFHSSVNSGNLKWGTLRALLLLFVAIAFSGLFDNTQFFKINLYLFVQFGAFGLQFLDLGHHCVDIDLLFLFERIDIARNIEIVVVLGNLL